MADEDVGNAIAVLQDLSKFATLADRLQQGLLNFLFLGRLMQPPGRLLLARGVPGRTVAPVLDTDELYFDGNSQGAILGGALCAVAQDFRRCVLGEAGMNYSTLLHRSVDFDLYKLVLDGSYPDPFTQLLVAEPGADAVGSRRDERLRAAPDARNRIRGRRKHTVLLLGAVGDHQVSEFALQVEARTMGAAGHVPYVAPGREFGGEHGFGITPIRQLSVEALGLLPVRHRRAAVAAREHSRRATGHDPHDDTPKIPAVQALKDTFWRTAAS